ncbi:bcl-2-related ovarian killer protein homolog B [Drosophila novamexicana]|uniref:bcl-2-related ovarian killer protein homolog B n=1 Tax=Drosophila novamexicana TaxID=47314 RepID=UPI0011E5CF47|nr:bcl-2-related ovarian killer protein homolog B [Drosophila novamexicana]XP_030554388.1 bcl-2-related ovarian killer protein homolog B [Drosophila novamexicana]
MTMAMAPTTAASATSTATPKSPTPTPTPKLAKFKSSSLDHEIYTANRRSTIATAASEWKTLRAPLNGRSVHVGSGGSAGAGPGGIAGHMTRAASTSSLASSTRTMTNYQEYKMEIINQGKCLCGQYIRARLRRAGVLNRKVIQRLRNILEPSSHVVYEVFPALNSMGEELERMHPRVYTNVSRQLSRAPFGELEDSDMAPMLLNLVAKDLFRSSITWGKIISIFSVCGGFAIDCVRQGHYDYLQTLVDGLAEIIEDDLVYWLIDNGGWLGLQKHIRPHVGEFTFLGWLTLFVTISAGAYVVSNVCKRIGCQLYSLLF